MSKKISNPGPPKKGYKPEPPPCPPRGNPTLPPPTPIIIKEGRFKKGCVNECPRLPRPGPPSGYNVLRLGSIVKYNNRKHIVIRIENYKKEKMVGLVRVFKGYYGPKILSVKYLFGKMINDLELLEE